MNKLTVLLLINASLFSQTMKIEEFLDTNVFLTTDSMRIGMANLEVPSIHDPDTARAELAQKILEYTKKELKNFTIRFEKSNNSCGKESISLGHLYKTFIFSEKNINAEYLKKGYAYYLPCDTINFKEYSFSAREALNNNRGLWQLKISENSPDFYNRLRISIWLADYHFREKKYFPLAGLNYRISDLISLYTDERVSVNLSTEVGYYFMILLPYVNFGMESRYKNLYIRGHYNYLSPFPFFIDEEPKGIAFWGYDIGYMLTYVKSGMNIEVEFSGKLIESSLFNYFISLNFTNY
jgi:hypothetical protein